MTTSAFELAHDLVCVELSVRTVIPFDHKRREPFLRSPHMVGHDGDGVVEAYDLTHALDGLGRRIIHALRTAAEHGRLCKGSDLHARWPNVDTINGRSVDFRRRVSGEQISNMGLIAGSDARPVRELPETASFRAFTLFMSTPKAPPIVKP